MPWIRRRARDAEPPPERLPDLEFLALVKASLERYAPGVTERTELKGNSLSSPHGWAIGVMPPMHGGPRHYDLVALPDTSLQPDVPSFMDCAVAIAGDAPKAADTWVQTMRRVHAGTPGPAPALRRPCRPRRRTRRSGLALHRLRSRRSRRRHRGEPTPAEVPGRRERAPPHREHVHRRPGIAVLQRHQALLRRATRQGAGGDPRQRGTSRSGLRGTGRHGPARTQRVHDGPLLRPAAPHAGRRDRPAVSMRPASTSHTPTLAPAAPGASRRERDAHGDASAGTGLEHSNRRHRHLRFTGKLHTPSREPHTLRGRVSAGQRIPSVGPLQRRPAPLRWGRSLGAHPLVAACPLSHGVLASTGA